MEAVESEIRSDNRTDLTSNERGGFLVPLIDVVTCYFLR